MSRHGGGLLVWLCAQLLGPSEPQQAPSGGTQQLQRGPSPIDWEDAGTVLGVNTHNPFPMAEAELDLLQEAGIRWIRNDIGWSTVETARCSLLSNV